MFAYYRDKVDEEALNTAVARAKRAGRAMPRGALAAHFYLFEKKSAATTRKLSADFDKNQRGARKLLATLHKARKDNFGRLNDLWINALLIPVSYTHLRAHETGRNLVCRLLLE